MRIGYKLASEAFGPAELIRQAVLAEFSLSVDKTRQARACCPARSVQSDTR